jgi:uncharacterized metal-binding protein
MSNSNSCACTSGAKLIFACSGAADVGALADQAARKLTRDGAGKMFCLAGIGGGVEGILNTTRAAGRILAIDGCSVDCVKHSLRKAGFTDFQHLQLAELGFEKGKSPLTDDAVEKVAQAGRDLL